MFNTFTVTDLVKQGEQVINNVWSILDHPDFPFVNLHSVTNGVQNFPPYNIIEQKDGKVRLELAVAGYTKDRLKVELEGNSLIIQGTSAELPEGEQIRHRGLSNKKFVRVWDMNRFIVIESVELKDGILTVTFGTKQPEEKKRTTFEIQ